ncbi:Secreted RxLR effector peptide protein [Phytophthora palmivora]|uniref:Secreted RxLR effector peptide protein n=1 Tax=Phytophthora palmivora TaxID=4796 RepID=A0A2P4WYF0_9STRA|nr:Secreted RxLR effector peptide protein [Phytophthora palmivora]
MTRVTFSLVLLVATFVAVSVGFSNAESAFFVHKSDNGFRGLRVSGNVHEERGGESLTKVASGLVRSDDAATNVLSRSESILKAADDEVTSVKLLLKKVNGGEGVGFTDEELFKIAKSLTVAQKQVKFSDEQLANFAKGIVDAKKAAEAARNSDDEVVKISEMLTKANSKAKDGAKYTDDQLLELSKALSEIQKTAGFSDKQMKKMTQLFAQTKQATTSTDESVVKLSQELVELAQKDKKSWSTLKKVIVSVLGVSVGGAVIYTTVKLATKDSPSPVTTVTSSGSS